MQLVQRCKSEHTIKSLIVSRNSLRSSTAVPWYNSARKKGTWCKCVCTFSLQFFTHHSQHAPLQCVCTFSLQFFTHQFTARTPPMCVHFFTAVFHLPVHSTHPSNVCALFHCSFSLTSSQRAPLPVQPQHGGPTSLSG